ncbi:ABC transporter family substrate-binding protein [Streptomyces sp. NBC_01022]|uniref:ABC transporter family substrate-binding protein n=1 Tax=Streptomyces sp. NBC_01022 TaxID=2903723 RepID=UPI002DD9728C|nr:ABC transporter substrate-binding protein [Streptomyces sp. NBC_01022]WRZ84187.1 ABC transporter substrate-binding protein [Streptomyces sp. NBC_01022]
MSHVGVPRGTSRKRRSIALLATGVLTLPVLAGCSSGNDEAAAASVVPQDIAAAARAQVAEGGTVNWAIDAMPATLNAFQADADSATTRITGALLPTLFPLDAKGRPQLNPDYLESAKVVDTEPKQVVLYRLNQQAVWSDGREIGAPDFVAQWRALSGKDSAFWTARNAGYERIEKIERGADDLEVKVTFAKPYADWRSLFSPLYPKQVTGSPDAFNDGARSTLKATAGPFRLREVDKETGSVTLARNPRWWGSPAKLDSLVFKAVEPQDRTQALTEGKIDVADIDAAAAHRIAQAAQDTGSNGAPPAHGPGSEVTPAQALRSWALAHGSDEEVAEEAQEARDEKAGAAKAYAAEQSDLRGYVVRKSLEPAYTQLALNGETGPLADDRVRRAVARALDRQALADAVLRPLGLPAEPLGSHLALAGQPAYKDGSDALGSQDTKEAQALLADAGWTREGATKKTDGTKAGSEGEKQKDAVKAEEKKAQEKAGEKKAQEKAQEKTAHEEEEEADSATDDGKTDDAARREPSNDDGLYIVGDDNKPGEAEGAATHVIAPAPAAAAQSAALLRQAGHLGETGTSEDAPVRITAQDRQPGGAAGAYAPAGTAAPAQAPDSARGPLGKDGKPLTLRFVLPSGPGSESLRGVGDRIAAMLDTIGIRTEITKVSDDSYFQDHVASGDYDLALYSWPATAYPATDDRPIFAKPVPATDGSLLVEQNYTRVGTDHIDQLFDEAVSELDEGTARDLMKQADARIWAAAGSIPLYQRPQLVATDKKLLNVGAFGFGVPHYQDIGFKAPQAAGAPANRKK